ncbi:MAG: hypothetical protein CSB33_00445 [Desulfobacterales bacterium]|nr:MAG: hypothetical protein CSB33_00445 [Desulfobacterales bacterium]
MAAFFKPGICLLLIFCLTAMPLGPVLADDQGMELEQEEETTAGLMAFDALLVRPAGFGATVLGTLVFVIALPFTLPTGSTGDSFDSLMKSPAQYTFYRPLGKL